ncbi:MAG TPA: alpha/beta hydrolase-fold protein [Opitutaceae bacterium]|nr:alpha/beta hydrolase-fold protein [Opitutaceae bacterium]
MKETEHRLRSAHLRNERTIWIREFDQSPTNLAVFLDAELYRDRVGAGAIVDALHAAGEIESTLFVFVSIESVASRWIECECHPPFARFIDEEFLPWLEAAHPFVRAARERVIVGLSYTGLAAAYVALNAPRRFTKVIAQSGSFWWNDCWICGHLAAADAKPEAEFYLDVGRRETHENVRHKDDVLQVVSQMEGVRRFRDALRGRGGYPKYVEFDGGHDFASWSLALPGALRWALSESGSDAVEPAPKGL